jgi:hypothetical protein
MAPDKQRNSRGTDDLLDWWTLSYRTIYLIGVVLLAAIGGGGYYYFYVRNATPPAVVATPPPKVATAARFASIEGNVKVKAVGTFEWVTADKDMVLKKGDLVKTGPGSTSEITFFDGTVVHVRPDSLITIEETSENPATRERRVAWHISSGEVLFNAPNKTEGRTDITTPLTRVTTTKQAEGGIRVGETGESAIRLFRGSNVQVETKSGEKVQLASNELLKVDADGNAASKVTLPGVPQLLAPPHQAEISYPDPQRATTLLAWRTVPGATGYHFQIDYSSSFNRPIKDVPNWKEAAVELRGLDVGKYYWRVAAVDKQNVEGSFSDFARFTVMRPNSGAAPPPPLSIEGFDLRTNILQIKGRTEPGATVSVNGQPLDVQPDGSFNEFITLDTGGSQQVIVRAVGVNGGVNEQRKSVVVVY